jgi:hypothetical protein
VLEHLGRPADRDEAALLFPGQPGRAPVADLDELTHLRVDRAGGLALPLRGVVPRGDVAGFRIQAAGWDLLGFEALDGHHADYAPGSPDLPELAALLRRLAGTRCPDIALRHAEQRLERYAAHPDDLRFFAGEHLLHTDLNHTNVLVNDRAPQGDRARLVDWAWATRGAAWLDAGYWVIWLVASGHAPASAEHWAAEVPTWHTAPAEGITAFAAANRNVWDEISTADPDPWTLRLAAAAAAWHQHRKTV